MLGIHSSKIRGVDKGRTWGSDLPHWLFFKVIFSIMYDINVKKFKFNHGFFSILLPFGKLCTPLKRYFCGSSVSLLKPL